MPWNRSHRDLVAFQSAGGVAGSHLAVARLIGTLTMIVVSTAAASETTATAARARTQPSSSQTLIAKIAATISVSGIRIGMTRPKVVSSPCSTAMNSRCGRRRMTGCTNA